MEDAWRRSRRRPSPWPAPWRRRPPPVPRGPGVLYSIRRDGDVFLLRGSVADDLAEADGGADGLRAFPTALAGQAQAIVEDMMNRRFPMDEDMIVSLGELGPGWRMESSPTSLAVHFKARGGGGREPARLGPIGDGRVASRCLAGLRDVLARAGPLADFHCSERSLRAACDGESPLLVSLADLFLGGRPLAPGVFERGERTLELFLGEVAAKRRFWLEVRAGMPPPVPS